VDRRGLLAGLRYLFLSQFPSTTRAQLLAAVAGVAAALGGATPVFLCLNPDSLKVEATTLVVVVVVVGVLLRPTLLEAREACKSELLTAIPAPYQQQVLEASMDPVVRVEIGVKLVVVGGLVVVQQALLYLETRTLHGLRSVLA
jgi:hypothetical protein